MTNRLVTAPVLALIVTAPLAAQTVPATNPAVKRAVDRIKADNAWTLDQQVSICEIPAPPFKETVRGAEYKRRLEALGLTVRIDSIGNVIAERKGTGNGPTVMIAGHLDTVFPEGTNVKVKREGTKLTAPGIGDDCRGLAVVLSVARAFQMEKVATAGTVIFVGNVGEEGPGNLRGTRHLFTKEYKGKIDYFISVDGTGLGVTSRAVGSNRYRVTYQGPGGHSYGAFGMPNPIHALGRAISTISDIQVPTSPKATFNVGIIEGGTSVNTISPSGAMDVDLRSESAQALAELDKKFQGAIRNAVTAENSRWPQSRVRISMKVDTIGIRPAGAQPDDAPIVRAAIAAGKALGFTAPTTASSTDANFPMSLGIAAITIDGGGDGQGAHATSESYDDGAKGWLGPQWAALLVATLAQAR
ncbi:MAG TPA: M20/M25/M40 family metallo-hydrolase [Gemmatimonadaceae bacterium]|nr:M20/M25/M40 family metallo-hydrolase [Gemmatimonadaceae bacterium]